MTSFPSWADAAAPARGQRGPVVVQGRGNLPGPPQVVLRFQQRRRGRLPGPAGQAGLRGGTGRHGRLAAAVLSLATAGRRLRHCRLHGRASRLRHDRRRTALHRGSPCAGACGSSPSWSSTTPATSTPGSRPRAALRPGRPSGRCTCGRTQTTNTPAPGSSSWTPRAATGPGTRWPGSTSGTASIRTSPT